MYNTHEFCLYYDVTEDDKVIVHCDVYEWNIGVARRLDDAAGDLMESLADSGYEECFAVGPVHPKFCEFMGGHSLGCITYEEQDYWVFRWALQQQ